MKKKHARQEVIKMMISSKVLGSQEELLQALKAEGFTITQATLSRDLKQLKVAKAANSNGQYVYVLPNDVMYKRAVKEDTSEMMRHSGFVSLSFSTNLAVVRTRPGYASSMAYDIDAEDSPLILGTIAGDDTILLVLQEKVTHQEIEDFLSRIIPEIDRF